MVDLRGWTNVYCTLVNEMDSFSPRKPYERSVIGWLKRGVLDNFPTKIRDNRYMLVSG